MGQSNVIFAAIFIAYLIYITMRGEIGIYWGLLTRGPPQGSSATPAQANNSGAFSLGNVAQYSADIATYAAAL